MKAVLPITKTKLRSENYSKEKVRQYALENKRKELAALAEEDTRVTNELQRMLYTPDEQLRWQIIDILGEICKKVGERRPDIVSKLLSNLFQSAASPATSAWGALETAGAIISSNPALMGEFSSPLLSFLRQKNLWKEVTWAIGRIAAADPKLVRYAFKPLRSFLHEDDPVLRGYAVWALGNIGYNDVIPELKELLSDDEKLFILRNSVREETTVAQLSKEALAKLGKCASQS